MVVSQGHSLLITCRTDHFNLSVVGEDFINDCCFGEDFSEWLVAALAAAGVEAETSCMEDFGWANTAEYEGVSYLVCVGGNSDGDSCRPNQGTWNISVERYGTLMQKLLRKNAITMDDAVVGKIVQVLRAAGFSDVRYES